MNEIAWAGTASSSADEWIELFNAGDSEADLTGWALYEGDTKIISLTGTIAVGGYYLVERTDDTTVSDIVADVFGPFGGSGLSNSGELLTLRNGTDVMDTVDASGGWPAGDAAAKSSMERGTDGTWHDGGAVKIGSDAGGNPVNGTPRSPNS